MTCDSKINLFCIVTVDCSVKKTDPYGCLNSYTVSGCSQYSNVPDECPNMCSFCPSKYGIH